MVKAWVYILKCSDGSYYVGSTENLEQRLAQHQSGELSRYTLGRRPVKLVYASDFPDCHQAFLFERQVKGWSRRKK